MSDEWYIDAAALVREMSEEDARLMLVCMIADVGRLTAAIKRKHTYCRDCDVARSLASMECSVCHRMRYTTDDRLAPIGEWLWGDRCACDPQPPSMLDVAASATSE